MRRWQRVCVCVWACSSGVRVRGMKETSIHKRLTRLRNGQHVGWAPQDSGPRMDLSIMISKMITIQLLPVSLSLSLFYKVHKYRSNIRQIERGANTERKRHWGRTRVCLCDFCLDRRWHLRKQSCLIFSRRFMRFSPRGWLHSNRCTSLSSILQSHQYARGVQVHNPGLRLLQGCCTMPDPVLWLTSIGLFGICSMIFSLAPAEGQHICKELKEKEELNKDRNEGRETMEIKKEKVGERKWNQERKGGGGKVHTCTVGVTLKQSCWLVDREGEG